MRLLHGLSGDVGPNEGMSKERAADAIRESRERAEEVSAPVLGLSRERAFCAVAATQAPMPTTLGRGQTGVHLLQFGPPLPS
jgi:hypothetical protein